MANVSTDVIDQLVVAEATVTAIMSYDKKAPVIHACEYKYF